MVPMTQLTIYTATYNRAHLLPQVYESLCRQTRKDFAWLIIDDGSTDSTRDLVQSWIEQGVVQIQYLFKENGGVHTARDLAYKTCSTELIVSCDSDDYLLDDAVEQILSFWAQHGSDRHAGIFLPYMDTKGHRVSGKFPQGITEATYQKYTYVHKVSGDNQAVFRTNVIAAVPPSPVFQGETLVPEGYKWNQLPADMPFLLLDQPVCVIEYQGDGYTQNVQHCRAKNPNGFRAIYWSMMTHGQYLYPRVKGTIGYIAFSLIVKDRSFMKEVPNPFLLILLLIPGVVFYWYRTFQFRRLKRK
jgi:glycosyltransferase involved in cell wall biosynthesis